MGSALRSIQVSFDTSNSVANLVRRDPCYALLTIVDLVSSDACICCRACVLVRSLFKQGGLFQASTDSTADTPTNATSDTAANARARSFLHHGAGRWISVVLAWHPQIELFDIDLFIVDTIFLLICVKLIVHFSQI